MIERVYTIREDDGPRYEEVVKSFWKEGRIEGTFNFDHFHSEWNRLERLGVSYLWRSVIQNKITGIIGALLFPDLLTGEKRAVVNYWYVLPEWRDGTQGMRLFLEMGKWIEAEKPQRLIMACRNCLNGVRMEKFYAEHGFEFIESHHMKELTWK